MVTEVFAPLAKLHAQLVGMPRHRITFTPHPISRVPAERCREYIEGKDPITGRLILDEVIEALLKPLTAEQKKARIKERPIPRLLGPDTEKNLQQFFIENKMTDYMPVILPTEKRVAEMLKGTSHKPDEVVGELRAAYESLTFTVEKVAANAVMAGAKPEYMPVILAMAASGVSAISSSTQSFARMIVVNGPIRKEIKMNSGTGALSPFNQANAVLGRVSTLMGLNLGAGGVPDLTYWGTLGNTLNYNHVTFAENEEGLPSGWKPYHVQKGFKPDESVVSFFHGYSIWHWKNTFEKEKNKAILHMANWVLPSGGFRSGFGLLLDPIVADDLVREGFPTKEALSEYVYKNTKLTLEEFWQYHLVEGFSLPAAQRGIEPFASWFKLLDDTLIPRFVKPKDLTIVVAGGQTQARFQAVNLRYMQTVSIDKWR